MKYKISQYAKLNRVTSRTVWNWIKEGKVKIERTTTNRVLIVDEDLEKKILNVAIYCRVSSSENKQNLESQKQRVLSFCAARGYNVTKIVCEIGSGLNDYRPKLESLLLDKSVDKIVVEHKDRLARFGINYIEKLLFIQNRSIEVINVNDNEKQDLIEDFVNVITSFAARLYGQRRSKRKVMAIIEDLKSE